MITAEDVLRALTRSRIVLAVPAELAVADALADAQTEPDKASGIYLLRLAEAIAAGHVIAGYDASGRYIYELSEAGRKIAQPAQAEPARPAEPVQPPAQALSAETPDVLTCSAQYADKNRAELGRHVRGGGVVRILDLRNRKVLEYRSQERPASLAGMPDDLASLWQLQRQRWSDAARSRPDAAEHLAAMVRARQAAVPADAPSQHPEAVRKRRIRARKKGNSK